VGNTEYTIHTLDIKLGIVGGFYGLLFKKNTALLKNFYSSETYNESTIDDILGVEQALGTEPSNKEIRENLVGDLSCRKQYKYTYTQYLVAYYIRFFNCCEFKDSCFVNRVHKLA
jgi:hypothetical protein